MKHWAKYVFDYYFKMSQANSIAKAAKSTVFIDLCNSIKQKNAQSTNTIGYIQYAFITRQVRGVNRVYPDITRHDVYNKLRRQAREAVQSPDADLVLVATDNGGM